MLEPMTKIDIDLPIAPLRIPIEEDSLNNVPVVASLLNGDTIRGSLHRLSTTLEIVVIQNESAEVIEIPFAKLKCLRFSRELPITSASNSKAKCGEGIEQADVVQLFQITFVDGSSIKGNTLGSIIDQNGLHLFKSINECSVVRLFIPSAAVKNYRIAPLSSALSGRKIARRSKQGTISGEMLDDYSLAKTVVNSDQLKQELERQIDQRNTQDSRYEIDLPGDATRDQVRTDVAKLGLHEKEIAVDDAAGKHLSLATKLGIPFVNLHDFDIELEALTCVPKEIARQYHLIPLCFYKDRLVVAMDDPVNSEAIDVVSFIAKRNIETAIATPEDIEAAFGELYEEEGGIDDDIIADEGARTDAFPGEMREKELYEAECLGKEKPIVRIVNKIIMNAIHRRASDIHVRPMENKVDLLFRIDGTLINIRSLSKRLLPAVVSRIKIIGRMDIAERRLPQDGQSRISDGKTVVDLRISVMPTVNGESVVIRLLNTEGGLKSVSELGFTTHDAEAFTNLLNKSYGILLVTGPTGSGKSTTLYAALQEVIRQNVNVITVEDPVEYHIDGVEQIQVNTTTGYTFARALRNILRHDPDVIMIGEIRDHETEKIAIESALTGHLVLSTLHTNNASSAVTRLLEMGAEPFLLKATMLGVLAQRLVRRNCAHCLEEEVPDALTRKVLGVTADDVFFKGRGCEHCNGTGYSGRKAVYELLTLTSAIRALIIDGVSSDAIHVQAVKEGMAPLTENALAQARQRVTSLAEVYRVRLE